MIERVCRCGGHGFPEIAKQREVIEEVNLRELLGTVKAAKLNIKRIDKNIVTTSTYDSKPVYFLSSLCSEVRWVKKTKKV